MCTHYIIHLYKFGGAIIILKLTTVNVIVMQWGREFPGHDANFIYIFGSPI